METGAVADDPLRQPLALAPLMAVKHGEHCNSVSSTEAASTMHEHSKQSLAPEFKETMSAPPVETCL